jgi:hypothetical protein
LYFVIFYSFTETSQEEKTDKMDTAEEEQTPPEEKYNTTLAQSYYLADIGTCWTFGKRELRVSGR